MLTVAVTGGTNAGKRILRPQATHDWPCPGCKKHNAYYWTKCPNCGTPRPY